MAIKNEFFETENNKKAQTQNTMDNSGGIGYNDNIGNTFLAGKDPFEASMGEWYKKYNDSLKYAGDSAKESVKNGLNEAPSYMKDAEPSTNFTDVQTASVKRSLAKDANDQGLYNSAVMEMIGLLSTENKEPYLKQAQPLQTYIDAKDNFDFKHNNYTTTKNIDTTPNEDVRKLQRSLNEAGYTDKMSQPLKEDGVFGGKTAYAYDTSRANVQTALQLLKNTQGRNTSDNNTRSASNKNDVDIAGITGVSRVGILQSTGYIRPKTSDGGNLAPGDERYNKIKQKLLKCLSANWHGVANNKESQNYIHELADKLREFDDNSFEKAVLLNKSDGASGAGHNAVMLINKDNEGLIFSFYPTNEKLPDALLTDGELRFSVLTSDEVDNFLYSKNKNVLFLVASDSSVVRESYDRYIPYDLTQEGRSGYNIYHEAASIYDDPGSYSLMLRQCDDIACEILRKGGINPIQFILPNWTYIISDKWNNITNKH